MAGTNGEGTLPVRTPYVDRGRSYRDVGNDRTEVYDLDLAAFLLMSNVPLAESTRCGREFLFSFLDHDHRIPKLAIDYVNSEAAKFASAQRNLKKVVHSSYPGSWRPPTESSGENKAR